MDLSWSSNQPWRLKDRIVSAAQTDVTNAFGAENQLPCLSSVVLVLTRGQSHLYRKKVAIHLASGVCLLKAKVF